MPAGALKRCRSANGSWPPDSGTRCGSCSARSGLLLMLACANVANLLIAQAVSRRSEIGIRASLGATRGRLVRQLFTESALLAALGTAAGFFTAVWSVDLVRSLGGGRLPRLDELRLDGSILAFACVAGAVSCLVFGLAPAFHAARVDLRSSLDEGVRYTRGTSRLRHGARRARSGACASARGQRRAAREQLRAPGQCRHRFRYGTHSSRSRWSCRMDATLRAALCPSIRSCSERVRALPGVIDAAATSTNPFRQFGFSNNVTPEERAADHLSERARAGRVEECDAAVLRDHGHSRARRPHVCRLGSRRRRASGRDQHFPRTTVVARGIGDRETDLLGRHDRPDADRRRRQR